MSRQPNSHGQSSGHLDRIRSWSGRRLGVFRDDIRTRDPVYLAFRHPGRVEKTAGAILLLLIAALVILILLFDWNWLRGPIGRWASAKYDREIVLQGDLDVHLFSWTPSVVVNRLKVGGPAWARAADTANVDRIEASVRLRKLFVGQVEMPLLSITRPRLILIADKDGRQSWDLEPDKPDDGKGAHFPLINQLLIQDGTVSLDEQRRGLTLKANVTASEATATDAGQTGFKVDGRGTMKGEPLTLTIKGGAFVNIRRDRPYGFSADLAGSGSRLTAVGSITRPFDLGRFQARMSLEGRNLADLYTVTGIAAPNTPRYRLAGNLSRDGAHWAFNDFNGRVGSSDLSGDLSVDRINNRLNVQTTLASRRLDIGDLTAVLGARPTVNAAGTDTTVTSGAPGKLLPDAPLNVERLRSMDGTLTYRAASVKANAFDISAVNLGADLKDGILKLNPVSFAFDRGTLNGTARIDARKATPYSTIDFRLSGYPLESIVPTRNGSVPLSGRALGRARLEGAGASVHQFAAGSKGSISLVVPQGEMRSAFAELLGVNASAGLTKLLRGDQSNSAIRCAVADFDVSGGLASAKTFVIDTDVVLAKGTGTIDLGQETLNLKIDGDSKRPRLIRIWTPITVRGALTAPKVGVDTGSLIRQAGVGGVLVAVVAPVAALFAFVDPGLAKDANCGALIAGAR